ncbi:lytic polysaccharide monooxygenase [Streptomyces sp. S1]|uniref:lytic polysaccharide monooxygenase n=1 Tax=Streptomyces sp. S1 TaxID=718288 RepID=UPI0027D23639|nr:lytic polysaccharide monooxygenase [Streptomyces sp. S1]
MSSLPSVRRATAAGAAALSAAALVGLTPTAASAHGAVFNPVSRVAACYAEGPETPRSQVCKDLVADSGTQPLYDWNEVNIANADGQHRSLIPDGKLCSANREKYRALDWARTDWPATAVAAGSFDFKVRATALSAEAAGTSSPLVPALAGAGALAAFAAGSLLLGRRRNTSAS